MGWDGVTVTNNLEPKAAQLDIGKGLRTLHHQPPLNLITQPVPLNLNQHNATNATSLYSLLTYSTHKTQ